MSWINWRTGWGTDQQPGVKIPRRTEMSEGPRPHPNVQDTHVGDPGSQGAMTENMDNMRGKSNAASGDVSLVECSGTFTPGC